MYYNKEGTKMIAKKGKIVMLIIQAGPVQEFLHFIIHNQESMDTYLGLSVKFNCLWLSALRTVCVNLRNSLCSLKKTLIIDFPRSFGHKYHCTTNIFPWLDSHWFLTSHLFFLRTTSWTSDIFPSVL